MQSAAGVPNSCIILKGTVIRAKNIRWKDGFRPIYCIIKYRFFKTMIYNSPDTLINIDIYVN
jgi:hypothetical protein